MLKLRLLTKVNLIAQLGYDEFYHGSEKLHIPPCHAYMAGHGIFGIQNMICQMPITWQTGGESNTRDSVPDDGLPACPDVQRGHGKHGIRDWSMLCGASLCSFQSANTQGFQSACMGLHCVAISMLICSLHSEKCDISWWALHPLAPNTLPWPAASATDLGSTQLGILVSC